MTIPQDPFNDLNAVTTYTRGSERNVPGWADMVCMADLLVVV